MNTRSTTLLICCFVLTALACKGTQTNAGANPTNSGACALLSASEIQGVQGEAVSDSQGSSHANGALVTTQCFYRLPTFSKSVSLEVMRPAASGESARAIAEFWERRFHQPQGAKSEAEIEREQERAREQREVKGKGERERDRGEEREQEEAKGAQPTPVAGIGDEAFWAGNQINSSFYVRGSNVIIRLSIGGPDEQSVKINKAKTLVEQVLKRL
jgi:hypothetical protein